MLQLKIIYEGQSYDIMLPVDSTILILKEKIKQELENQLSITTIPEYIELKTGFPPKPLLDNTKTLLDYNLGDRETLRLTLTEQPVQILKNTSGLIRKIIPADNSCLFNAINYAMNTCLDNPDIMRELIAVEIKSNPDIYNEAILDKNPFDYCEWIMRNDTWGGGIELSIFSKCFQLRIGVVDINNVTIEYFGEDYSNIIYLLYDGIHYDVLVREEKYIILI
jgi:ubiquitin thioesterase OTU1